MWCSIGFDMLGWFSVHQAHFFKQAFKADPNFESLERIPTFCADLKRMIISSIASRINGLVLFVG